MNNENISSPLPNGHEVYTFNHRVCYVYNSPDDGAVLAYSSIELPHLPSQGELDSIALLLWGGADYGDVNSILLSLAGQKDGRNYAGAYRAKRSKEIVQAWTNVTI